MNEDRKNTTSGENNYHDNGFGAPSDGGWGVSREETRPSQPVEQAPQGTAQPLYGQPSYEKPVYEQPAAQTPAEQEAQAASPMGQPSNGQPISEQPAAEGRQAGQAEPLRQAQSPMSQPMPQQPAYPAPHNPAYHYTPQGQNAYNTQGIYGGGQRQPREKKHHEHKYVKRFLKGVGALVLVAAVSVGSTIGYLHLSGTGDSGNGGGNAGAGGTKVVYQPTYSEDSLTAAQIYADNVSSVVAITSQLPNGSGVGTGIIMKEDGYIITNDHVVGDAVSISVRTYDGNEYQAELIGTDEKTDIAVIKISATGLKAATFGDSDELVVGEPAIVIGNPLGLEFANTMTQGAVSSTSRDIQIGSYIMNVIQTDASINPGNSGGPMFNSRGEVVGVVSSKIKTSEAVGIGFAIPSNTALKIANDFISYGSVQDRPMLGVTVEEINAYYAQMQGVEMGVRVAEVVRGGAAEQAGIKVGDYITQFNGEEVTSISELNYAKDQCKVGDTVKVDLKRQGEKVTVDLVLKDANQLAS